MLNLQIFNKSYGSNWLFLLIFHHMIKNSTEETKIVEGFFQFSLILENQKCLQTDIHIALLHTADYQYQLNLSGHRETCLNSRCGFSVQWKSYRWLWLLCFSNCFVQLLKNVVKVKSHVVQNTTGSVPISKPDQIVLCNCFRASHLKCSSSKQDQEYFIPKKTYGFLSLSCLLSLSLQDMY